MASHKPTKQSNGLTGMVVDHAVYQSFSQFTQTEAWSPAVNIYEVGRELLVCVDLAGIDRDKIDVRIEPGRLTVSGVRHSPEPDQPKGGTQPREIDMKIHSMEIDYGAFCRVVQVPRQVDLKGVKSEYRRGILWITMPLN